MGKRAVKVLSTLMALSMINVNAYAKGTEAANKRVEISYNYDGADHTRKMEKLNRGLVAVKTEDGVYLSWRMTGDECSVREIVNAPNFSVYRNGEKIAYVEDSTNYTDVKGTLEDRYSVALEDGEQCEEVEVWADNYIEIPLSVPETETVNYLSADGAAAIDYSFRPADTSCGDVDGDGEYELIVKWVSAEKDVGSPGDPAYSGTVRFAAYKLDGTKLWDNEINLGKNVYSSAHTVQFLVYDFDGDGKAELICQTSVGSKDAKGNYVTKAANPLTNSAIYNVTDEKNETTDYRSAGWGLITTGAEFLTVFNGETGEAMDTIFLPTKRVNTNASEFGDTSGNRSNRFIADVAYLDGENPYAVYWRGYYTGKNNASIGRTAICGVGYKDGRLSCDYNYDTYSGQPGYKEENADTFGNGNHNMTVADVDDDGKDEVISGTLCVELDENNELSKKWCAKGGHGDALHIGDYDPTHKGLEYFTVHEHGGTFADGTEYMYGQSVIDPATGKILFHTDGTDDTGRGIMGNFGIGGYYQTSSSKAGHYIAEGNGKFTPTNVSMGMNFRIFWDGDLYDESFNHTNYVPEVYSWNGTGIDTIFRADGTTTINGTKAVPCLQADLFGDWREELVLSTSDGTKLRVYTTTEQTNYKLPSLMHDPVYRSGVAAQQSAYNQPPHVGFYLAEETFKPRVTSMELTPPTKLVYKVGEELDLSGMKLTASYNNGSTSETTDFKLSGYEPLKAGVQTVTVKAGEIERSFEVSVITDFETDANGTITGYTGTDTNVSVPVSINGTGIKKIADGVLDNTEITDLYVYDNITDMGENSLKGITVHCYEGSAAHFSALDKGANYELMGAANTEYLLDVNFSEEEYKDFKLLQATSPQTKRIGDINYGVGARSKGGDGKSGFEVVTDDSGDGRYLCLGSGRFSNGGRNGYMNFVNIPSLSDESDIVLKMRVNIPSKTTDGKDNTAYIGLDDAEARVDEISSANLGIDNDKWYEYSLVYHRGEYYRFIKDENGNEVSSVKLAATGSKTGIEQLVILSAVQSDNDQRAEVYMDDLKLYTTECAVSELSLRIEDVSGKTVSGASVSVGGKEYISDINGTVHLTLVSGVYDVLVKADGYANTQIIAAAYKENALKTIVIAEQEPDSDTYTVNTEIGADGRIAVSRELKDGKNEVYGAKLYAAQYKEGRLLSVNVTEAETIELVKADEADELRAFVWSKGLKAAAEKVSKLILN